MRNSRPLIALTACAVLFLGACTPIGDPPAAPTTGETRTEEPPEPEPFTPPDWPELALTSATGIAGLDSLTISDNDAQIHVVLPQIEGHDVFNTRLEKWGEGLVADFREDYAAEPAPAGESSPDPVAAPWLSATWGLTAIGDLVGIVLNDSLSPGASVASEQAVLWYDPEGGAFLSWKDLLTPEAREALPELLVEGLKGSAEEIRTGDIDVEMLTALLDDDDLSVGFDDDGGLVVTFDAYTVLAGSYGSPAVAFTAEDTAAWLTEAGDAAREATLAPDGSAVPEQPVVPEPETVDCEEHACVALTFDDGPGGSTTPELLEILAEEDVPATFFVLGAQAQSFPDIVASAAEAGHEIASHTWNHASLPDLGEPGVREQLQRTSAVLEEITGIAPTLMRPPYGATDSAVASAAKAEGLAQVLWNIDTRDWDHRSPKKTIAEAAKVKAGAIILMHDTHPTTIDAVPGVIDALREKGFTFVTVSTLLGETRPGQKYFSR